uniref:pyrimidine/purine nucleosidase domain-containing protein n=1 Tax=Sodalis endosymbiont of Henestaris halophilus TaxID=1929246 RepID=UPI0012FE6477|nr:pyrimidine/purine nucleosidase domain-containing protein [Sodalis endosymbiont of Henestaris halophilus]
MLNYGIQNNSKIKPVERYQNFDINVLRHARNTKFELINQTMEAFIYDHIIRLLQANFVCSIAGYLVY